MQNPKESKGTQEKRRELKGTPGNMRELKETHRNSREFIWTHRTQGKSSELIWTYSIQGNLKEVNGTWDFSREALVEVMERKKLRKRGKEVKFNKWHKKRENIEALYERLKMGLEL